jgi:hypothetical protein
MDIQCTHCQSKITDYADVAYEGPKDRSSTSCDPFQAWEVVCKGCNRKESEEINV